MVQQRKASRLKNYTSQASMDGIFGAIQQALAAHKARKIQLEFDDEGNATSIQFVLVLHGVNYTFRLPARFENVRKLVAESYRNSGKGISGDRLDEQAYRTAWANIRDWVSAQMAIIDSGMVKMEEVFMPYLLVEENMTMFEVFEQQKALPPAGSTIVQEVE